MKKRELFSQILLFHEVLRVILVALIQHHLCELLQLVASFHVVDKIHQQLDSVLVFNQFAVLLGVNLEDISTINFLRKDEIN